MPATSIPLTGTGAAYIRVSKEQSDTVRQHNAIRSFETQQGIAIPKALRFEDEGWARDKADERPEFLRLMKLAETGKVNWIVVSERDRFGTKDADEFMHFRYLLRKWGCRLFDAAGTDWTQKDIATVITAVVEGEKSEQEQHGISKRTLSGKVARAREGEWQGGPVRLGLDVVCFSRETGRELWRVVAEGKDKRLKVYPDGRSERFDGEGNFPKFQEKVEVLRLAPSRDRSTLDAVVSVFTRFAEESVSTTALAHYLSDLGFRTCSGGRFQSHHVESMLEDPIYLGYYTYNRRHFGKFHRWTKDRPELELNYDEKQTHNDRADWVQSPRLFEPLIGVKTWDAVQKKLDRPKRKRAPRSPGQHLAQLVYCGNCGARMVAGPVRKTTGKARSDGHTGERFEYFCGSYAKCVREKRKGESKCLRNGVFQDVLEGYVERFLEETGKRLEILVGRPELPNVTDKLHGQESDAWWSFREGVKRLGSYLAEHHPEEYEELVTDFADQWHRPDRAVDGDDFAFVLLGAYEQHFDSAAVAAERKKLDDELAALTEAWTDLPTARAKQKAKERLEALSTRLDELDQQGNDLAEKVRGYYQEMTDLQRAIAEARRAMRAEDGEEALRRRSESVRSVIQRIECTFVATGEKGSGWGKKNARLTSVTIFPVSGDSAEYPVASESVIFGASEWALEYHEVPAEAIG